MKIVIAGGTGQVGNILRRHMSGAGHQVVTLSRKAAGSKVVAWDGRSPGSWTKELEGADVVINLAGRSVNCRYTKANLREMMDSRVLSTKVIGQAISQAAQPPRLWLQMSTATIYAHRFDADNDEANGIIGGSDPDVPGYWRYSIDIARSWERALEQASTPETRKVALRSAMVMSADPGGIFDTLLLLTRRGLGGAIAGGRQYVSWIHERDFVRALEFLIESDLSGPVNLSSPCPLPQREFMAAIRKAAGVRIGLPATQWMAEIGAFFMRTDTELILKGRRVRPGRLLAAGCHFEYEDWPTAAANLTAKSF